MNTAVLFSSASAEWATPAWLFDALNARFWWGWSVLAGGFAHA